MSYYIGNLRRSLRIRDRPPVVYYPNDQQVLDALSQVCYDYDWVYSDDLVEEFYQRIHFAPNSIFYDLDSTYQLVPRTTYHIAYQWAILCSNYTYHLRNTTRILRALYKQCSILHIPFHNSLLTSFLSWSHNNTHLLTYTSHYKIPTYSTIRTFLRTLE